MIEASDIWAGVEEEGDYIDLPPYITRSGEAAAVITPIQTDIDTYVDSCLVKFINGDMNFDADYETLANTVQEMGIDQITQAYQDAYKQ